MVAEEFTFFDQFALIAVLNNEKQFQYESATFELIDPSPQLQFKALDDTVPKEFVSRLFIQSADEKEIYKLMDHVVGFKHIKQVPHNLEYFLVSIMGADLNLKYLAYFLITIPIVYGKKILKEIKRKGMNFYGDLMQLLELIDEESTQIDPEKFT